MSSELIQKQLLTRRAFIMGACKATLMVGLCSRMFYLQVLNNKEFTILSEKNRIKMLILPPLRGRILDRDNVELASNEQVYQLNFEKLEIHNEQNLHDITLKLADILSYSPEQQADLIKQLNKLSINEEDVIAVNLTWQQLMKLELYMPELIGANIAIGYKRLYPYTTICGHITGYLGTISEKESHKTSLTLYPNVQIGKNGIEKTQESTLHGSTGVRRIEVNAKGEMIKDISTSESIAGQDATLSINIELQKKAAALFADNTGVALLANIHNGEILVSLSQPSFDPNLFNQGISSNAWNNLINNPEQPLIDRSVALTYPPGSGFKINVAIAALKQNFNPETRFTCPGHYVLGNRVFHCWKKGGHGSVNLYQAIAGSCNVYFWNVAKIIGIQPIADTAKLMGYSKKLLNNLLPREQKGIIPDPEWKKQNIGTAWTMADTINSAIGQGYVEATPMQILTMAARIASGKEFMPTLLKQEQNDLNFASLNLDKELALVKKGMEIAVNSDIGTAYMNRITTSNLEMAGKTGTSQVISKRHANDDLSHANVMKKIKNHGIFVAYAPLTKPKYAFCGIIEHGGTPALAVKVAKELLTEAQLKNI